MTRIEITPVVSEADERTINHRTNVVQRLNDLGQIDATDGTVNTETTRWQATINGATVPIDGYAVEPDGDRVLVSLVLPADSVSIGRPTAAAPVEDKSKPGVWGDSSRPDPRESIPGWAPQDAHLPPPSVAGRPVGAQVAIHGESSVRARLGHLGSAGVQA